MAWEIIAAFIAGEMTGLLVAAIVSGKADDFMEWRKRKHEQKKFQNFHVHYGGYHRDADRAERDPGKPENVGR